jgi:hypothetical protein
MKNLILLALLSLTFLACDKKTKEPVNAPAKNIKEALARLSAVKTWKISTITSNGKLVYENNGITNPDYDSIAEWLKFDISTNKIEVKYPESSETSFFKYEIDEKNQTFVVREIGENNELSDAEI